MPGPIPLLAGQVDDGAMVALAVVIAAFAGALLAGLTRVPKPAGYLVAGVALGPAALGWVTDREQVNVAAEIGVALLLFSVGLELSLRELGRNLKGALLIGLGEALTVGSVVLLVAPLFDVSTTGALILAGAATLSSTAAGVALIAAPGSRLTALAPIAVGVLIVQDVLAVVIIALVPSLDEASFDVVGTAAVGVGLALLLLFAALPLAAAGLGILIRALAGRVDRELFLVAVLAAVGGTAAGAAAIGLSPALGAFVAGLLIRQTGYGRQAIEETVGLRDVFSAIFFVSVGLLFDPGIVTEEPGLVLLLAGAVIGIKFGAISILGRVSGFPWRAALLLATTLANAGEFSFVVVEVADIAVLGDREVSALVFVVVVSLLGSSLLVGMGATGTAARRSMRPGAVVVVGYGRLGRELARSLRTAGHDIAIVERDADEAREALADGFPVVWGDILHAGIAGRVPRPSVLVVTPGGEAGRLILSGLARSPYAQSRIVSVAMPLRPSSLGLDLRVLDVDRRAGEELTALVTAALSTPVENVRYPYRIRDDAVPADAALPGASHAGPRLLALFPWGGPAAGECPSAPGRGRKYTWPIAVTCPVCRGPGRANDSAARGAARPGRR